MGNSKIEWTQKTWNPLRAELLEDTLIQLSGAGKVVLKGTWGYHCERISPGCGKCYACTMNGRTLPAWGTGLDYAVPNRDKVRIYLDEQVLTEPLRWRKPTTAFVCSMTDLFADFVPDELIDRVFAVMALCPQHTFQVLTKRSKRMREYFSAAETIIDGRSDLGEACMLSRYGDVWDRMERRGVSIGNCTALSSWPLPNVWLGVSVEDQQRKDRIDVLRETPAAVRFLSLEPLLEDLGTLDLRGIDWVIVGGESGPGARPCTIDNVRSIVQQCEAVGVPCFVKQLGHDVRDRNDAGFDGDTPQAWPMDSAWAELDSGYQGAPVRVLLDDRKGGDPREWPEDLRVRQMPEVSR